MDDWSRWDVVKAEVGQGPESQGFGTEKNETNEPSKDQFDVELPYWVPVSTKELPKFSRSSFRRVNASSWYSLPHSLFNKGPQAIIP